MKRARQRRVLILAPPSPFGIQHYSERYQDDNFEYRHVILPKVSSWLVWTIENYILTSSCRVC